MKKRILLFTTLVTLFLIILISTYTNKSTIQIENYNGSKLNIGIIGTKPNTQFNNVIFHQLELQDIGENKQQYDAFMLTEEVFQEASLPENKGVFFRGNLKTPVFFIGLYKPYWIFAYDFGKTYNEELSYDYMGHTQGFLMMEDGSIRTWTISLKNYEKNEENIYDMYLNLFSLIEDIKYGNLANPVNDDPEAIIRYENY
ncbi:hypothetical protein V1503_02890 [Bacillus sp. SCS-151]|uniref:hypothetical protein n=1 Tax=Nanhaiella sioensis TaxID=3115293 RepID=UPI00397C1AE4